MSAWVWIGLIVIVVLIVAGWLAYTRQRSQRLRQTFGPEYERAVTESGDRRKAEAELEARRERRQKLDIRPLSPESRAAYGREWTEVQSRFVDAPQAAVAEADAIVIRLMGERGYPMEDFEQRAADISVDHPAVVDNYRQAHAVASRSTSTSASTEDLRMAIKRYGMLFDELLGDVGTGPAGAATSPGDQSNPRPEGRRELT